MPIIQNIDEYVSGSLKLPLTSRVATSAHEHAAKRNVNIRFTGVIFVIVLELLEHPNCAD